MRRIPLNYLGSRGLSMLTLAATVSLLAPDSAVAAGGSRSSTLFIEREPGTGILNLTWSGGGTLKQSPTLNGTFKPVRGRGKSHRIEPVEDQQLFRLEAAGQVFSVNIVGYINTQVPPGVSLLANQLWNQDNTVALLIHNPPHGAQIFKYVEGAGYEVSTYDGESQTWSNPDMTLTPGIGFFYRNPSTETIVNTFVGEVYQGTLVNRLPAGFSTEGALVPQTATLSEHLIPGEPGDVIRLHVSGTTDDYITSVYSANEGWVPNLTLGVGQGFISERANSANWVRIFWAF